MAIATAKNISEKEERGIIGVSPAMRKIADVIEQVAPTDLTVLITGESGVGKEIVAKAVHQASRRSTKPLITVNCGAIPDGIIESELFGHERGSFTGASEQRRGYFELADGGTIFLDEIGELNLSAQVKFLRVLESGEFLRVGSSVTRRVDVRVIAATNKDLELEVRHRTFRDDLFFRLRSVNIHIPPLRERPEDIGLLFEYFADDITQKNGITFRGISTEALELLRSYRWPGNVRELRNAAESMIVLERGKYLQAAEVRRYLPQSAPSPAERNLPVPMGRSVEQAERELILRALLEIKGNILELRDLIAEQARTFSSGQRNPADSTEIHPHAEETTLSLQDMEQKLITEALERYKGNRRVAARALNISERTLYRKIKEYGLDR
jgi:DNA-binding NtrC family response regulator